MGANGAIGKNRTDIYAQLYRAAGEKWVQAGTASHAICLYAHDKEAQGQFFRYGFGMRCVDAIYDMSDISMPICDGYTFSELAQDELLDAYHIDMMLHRYCLGSPFFMVKLEITEAKFLDNIKDGRCFVARRSGEIVAFLYIGNASETFLCGIPGYICRRGFLLSALRRSRHMRVYYFGN